MMKSFLNCFGLSDAIIIIVFLTSFKTFQFDFYFHRTLNERHAHLDALRRQLEPEPIYTQGVGVGDSSNLIMMGQVSSVLITDTFVERI